MIIISQIVTEITLMHNLLIQESGWGIKINTNVCNSMFI
jgi:hypothetical protein